MINRKDSNALCALTDIILTFLSFELQKWVSSQNWSEFSQEFNSEYLSPEASRLSRTARYHSTLLLTVWKIVNVKSQNHTLHSKDTYVRYCLLFIGCIDQGEF